MISAAEWQFGKPNTVLEGIDVWNDSPAGDWIPPAGIYKALFVVKKKR